MRAVVCRRAGLAAVLGVAVLAGTVETPAGVEDRSWEIGADVFNTSFGNSSNIDDALGFGVRGAYAIRAAHALEFSVDQATGDHATASGVEFDVLKYSLDYLHNFILKRSQSVAPFVTLGYGILEADDGTSTTDSSVIRFGGGSRFFVSPRFAIRVGAVMYHWNGDGGSIPRESFFSFDLLVGASFVFGGGESAPKPATEPAPAPVPEPAPAPAPEPTPAPEPSGA